MQRAMDDGDEVETGESLAVWVPADVFETAERLATVFPGTNRSCWNVDKPSPCGSEGRFSLTPCSEARRKAMKTKIHRRARG